MDLVTRSILWGVTLLLAHFLWNYFRSPLKSFPGPIATRFTNIWRLMTAFGGQYHITNIELHRRHGPAVRVGPKTLSLSDPALINKAYATRDPWTKVSLQSTTGGG